MNFFSRKSRPHEAAVDKQRARIRRLCSMPIVDSKGKESIIKVPEDRFISSNKVRGAHFILCSLDTASEEDITIMNCVMGTGSLIPEHAHASTEDVFVLSGSITETVSGNTYLKGDSLTIKPNQPHSFTSDYALISMSWVPSFRSEYEEYTDPKIVVKPELCQKVLLDKQ